MATDKELSGFIVNEVESDDKLSKISQEQTLEPNQIFVTKDGIISDNAVGLPIGAIFASAIPITDARVHLLDGSYISRNGVYQEFATLIKSLVASGQNISCSETQFDEDVSKTGNCGKFVITNNGTIRLPKITTFIQGLSSIANIGSSFSAGLPNITGEISRSDEYPLINMVKSQSGALSPIDRTTTYGNQTQGGSSTRPQGISFDASKSNSIYGNSTTVQPNATQFPYYIVLASGYKSKKSLNIDNIMNEVNSKTTLDAVYPIGSIYLTLNEHGSPAKIFGGTWERISAGYALWTASSGAGGTISAGLPNITGKITVGGDTMSSGVENARVGGAFRPTGSEVSNAEKGGGGGKDNGVTFNASRSSSIYGKSTTVQPPAYKVYAYKRVPDDESDVEVDNY